MFIIFPTPMKLTLSLFFSLLLVSAYAQVSTRQPSSSEIRLKIKKLNFLGSVLYVAAHPDDENTRAITFLVNDQLAATGYLSMTRGDGGQNLIGPEIRDELGLIRTQELLAARRIDGGRQFFTRANDFGFSKSPEETFAIWNKAEILSDVVKVIRQFQPDVIITRFPPDIKGNHGHHSASAILAAEAFDLTNDAAYEPDQVKTFGQWQAKRLLTNTGPWWNKNINASSPGVVVMNVGAYNSLLGKSSSEIAATSRTQHKSQGFGSPGQRGDALEFFEYVKGDKAVKNIFDGVNTTWSRIAGGEKIPTMVTLALKEFNDEDPAASIRYLLSIRNEITGLSPSVWKQRKLDEVNTIIQDCLGLFIAVNVNHYWNSPGKTIVTNVEMINRSSRPIELQNIQAPQLKYDTMLSLSLKDNVLTTFKSVQTLSANEHYSDPYWLRNPHSQGLFNVTDKSLIGLPENDPAISFTFNFLLFGYNYSVVVPVVYKWTDPVKGELFRPAEIVPPVFVNLLKPVYLFHDQDQVEVSVLVKSSVNGLTKGDVFLEAPTGWKSSPTSFAFEFSKAGEEQYYQFKVTPGKEEMSSALHAYAVVDGNQYNHSIRMIQYDHIPIQTQLPIADSKAVRLNLKTKGHTIGYIRGAGDEVAAGIRNMGFDVWEMKDNEITAANLQKVSAVVLGIRALNTNERIRYYMPVLLNYVNNGGTMVVQYNNNNGLAVDAEKLSPYPITLSRDRVTEENSEVRILLPDHPLLNSPNKITAKDFAGWVQERGLYYPSKWDAHYQALLSSNDTGEPALDGGVLVAQYGKGTYIYTSLSFFRQLPEGVVGAYKLFANMISK